MQPSPRNPASTNPSLTCPPGFAAPMVSPWSSLSNVDLESPAARRRLDELDNQVTQLAEQLPFLGPITAFVFLNPLMGMEGLPFDEAVRRGAALFGCEAYLAEDRYHEKLNQGRITADELSEIVRRELAERAMQRIGPRGTLWW